MVGGVYEISVATSLDFFLNASLYLSQLPWVTAQKPMDEWEMWQDMKQSVNRSHEWKRMICEEAGLTIGIPIIHIIIWFI